MEEESYMHKGLLCFVTYTNRKLEIVSEGE